MARTAPRREVHPTPGARPAKAGTGSSGRSESKYDGIVELQRSAGNNAVSQLLTIQRHSTPSRDDETAPSPPDLHPESEAPPGQAQQQQGPAPAPLIDPGAAGNSGPGSATAAGLDLSRPAGLRSPARMDSQIAGGRFGRQMVDEEHQWATQTGPDARARALTDMVGRTLSDAGVDPVPGYTLRTDLSPSTLGNFGFPTWKININQRLVERASLTTAQADEIANTMYHEGRHCDQWFRMARLRAGQGQRAADIASSMQIPNNVAVSAANSPLAPGSAEATEAQGWWDSVYGTNGNQRTQTLNELAAADTANSAAAAAYQADHSDANMAAWRTAWDRQQVAFRAYQALPEEVSARAAASTMQAALTLARQLNGKDIEEALRPPPRPGRREGIGDFPLPARRNEGAG